MKGFEHIIEVIRSTMAALPDARAGNNGQYSMQDAGLAAFSVFFMQSPSFLAAQQAMEQRKGKSNALTLFKVGKIPCTNQVKNLLDPVAPAELFPVYDAIYNELRGRGVLEGFRGVGGTQLIAVDATWYYSSEKVHCANCSQKKGKDGTTTYSHSAITPVIVAPGIKRAISLRPEFITPQDGDAKQDCELKAAKRWLAENGALYHTGNDTLLGDDLYAHQPFCRQVLLSNYHFIFVCKPASHKYLYEWLELLTPDSGLRTLTKRVKGKGNKWEVHTLRFANRVPLAGGDGPLHVNWVEHVVETNGKQAYKNAFVTDHAITAENALEIANAGRARWKVENENNNTLKTKGYHLDHNFGHGKQYLSSLLASMNILAFLLHTLLDVGDARYQLIRQTLGARRTFFEHVRALTHYQCFAGWDEMMDFMMRGLEIGPYDTG